MPEKAKFYHALQAHVAQCDLCHHFCKIRDGRYGFCRTRVNRGGKLFTLNYGHPAAIGTDPVEKKPLYHFLPGSLTFSLGTYGCNFRCDNCQNWEISQKSGHDRQPPFRTAVSVVQDALARGCPSISFTYNEPTIFAEYALDIMKPARSAGLKNIWVSNGYMSDYCLDTVAPLLDAVNIDLKSMDDAFYRRTCSALQRPVLQNLKRLARSDIHLEITTLLLPGLSDSPEMLRRLADFIAVELGPETPWHLSSFVPWISWKSHDIPATTAEGTEKAHAIGKKAGLAYVYDQHHHTSTLCPKCGTTIVERHRYTTIRHDKAGSCPGCGYPIVTQR